MCKSYKFHSAKNAQCCNCPQSRCDSTGCNAAVDAIADGILAHWNRNDGLNDSSNLPATKKDAINQGWVMLPIYKSVYHNRNDSNNSKFISSDGHREAVYDDNGKLVDDPLNRGTYNIYNPNTHGFMHLIYDVLPLKNDFGANVDVADDFFLIEDDVCLGVHGN